MDHFIPYSTLCHDSAVTLNDKIMSFQENCKLTDKQLSDSLHTPMSILYALRNNNVYTSLQAISFFEDAIKGDFTDIKSHIGSLPTLFNSSQSSGFVYKVVGCDVEGMHRLNYLDSFIKIIKAIKQDYSLEYVGCRNEIFEQNLRMIDWRMDDILSYAMLMQIGYKDGWKSNSIEDMCASLAEKNPLGARNPQYFYESKMKSLLFASFAGMTATTEWNGRKKLSGGYIDVDKKGEMLYYRAISDDIFENYLYKHTFIDRPDGGREKDLAVAVAKARIDEQRELTDIEKNKIVYKNGKDGEKKSKKEDFGYIYQKDEEFYFVVNFKIRFR